MDGFGQDRRRVRLNGDVAYIKLTRGLEAIIDTMDLPLVMNNKWCASTSGYAVRTSRINGVQKTVSMHRAIIDAPEGREVDHINRNRLDNRRSNLRIVTSAQNSANRARSRRNTSGYTGVTRCHGSRRWRAQLTFNGRYKHLGCWESRDLAAWAYRSARQRLQLAGDHEAVRSNPLSWEAYLIAREREGKQPEASIREDSGEGLAA